MTEEEINQILDEYFESDFFGRLQMLTGGIDLQRFLGAIEGFMSASGLRYRHETDDGIQTYIVQHDMGKNITYYLESYFKKSLKVMKAKDVEVRRTKDTLRVEFRR